MQDKADTDVHLSLEETGRMVWYTRSHIAVTTLFGLGLTV